MTPKLESIYKTMIHTLMNQEQAIAYVMALLDWRILTNIEAWKLLNETEEYFNPNLI